MGQAYSGLAQKNIAYIQYLNPANGTNQKEFGISYSTKSELILFDDLTFNASENGLPISFYFNFPISDNFIVQFNYTKKFSLTAEIGLQSFNLPDIGFSNLEPYIKSEVNEYSLPLSYQITDQLSVGAALIYDQINYELYVDPFLNNLIEDRTGDAAGFIFKAGLLYQVHDNINFAFVFQPEKSILITNDESTGFDFDYLEFLSYGFGLNIHSDDQTINLNYDLYYRDIQNNEAKDHVIDYNLALSFQFFNDFSASIGNFFLSDASELGTVESDESISQNYLTAGLSKQFNEFYLHLAFATSKWGEQNESSHYRFNAGLSFQF